MTCSITAILYRKSLALIVNISSSSNLSITGTQVLFLTVYMHTEYNESMAKCIDVCAHVNSIITDSCIPRVIIAGNFICQSGSRLYAVLSHLTRDNNLGCHQLIQLLAVKVNKRCVCVSKQAYSIKTT